MNILSKEETMQVSAGSGNVRYNIGHTMGGWYAGAVDKTADFFERVDGLGGSVSD
ncbi:hypothetical protein [Metallibacterium sp.]|jgi:hypothetical protein|uniref:hypothetical protein n=1 Tax=Metallibacterium sp. TaxID=2940281 RepID=UPI0026037BC8|nr:hypothetical protein [Metallibacterium sp.]